MERRRRSPRQPASARHIGADGRARLTCLIDGAGECERAQELLRLRLEDFLRPPGDFFRPPAPFLRPPVDFLRPPDDFFRPPLDLRGTFPPLALASLKPIAIACFR